MTVRRAVYVLGLAILLALIGALAMGLNQDPLVFGHGRLHFTTGKFGLLVFLLILAPFAFFGRVQELAVVQTLRRFLAFLIGCAA